MQTSCTCYSAEACDRVTTIYVLLMFSDMGLNPTWGKRENEPSLGAVVLPCLVFGVSKIYNHAHVDV